MSHLCLVSHTTERGGRMLGPNRRKLSTFALALLLGPSGVEGQTARKFEELGTVLKANDLVAVSDETGQRSKGRVVSVSGSSLVVSISTSAGKSEARTFAPSAVTKIMAADRLWNGALIGAAAGAGLAMWDYLIDSSEPGNAAIFTVAIGVGDTVGTALDALLRKLLYQVASTVAECEALASLYRRSAKRACSCPFLKWMRSWPLAW